MDLTTAAEISVAALGQGITPIARVASHEAQAVAPLLDSGTQGHQRIRHCRDRSTTPGAS